MSRRLYELATADDARLSPYCWRARMALAHKGMAFDAVAVGFTEIAGIAQGQYKTVPVLHDGAEWIADHLLEAALERQGGEPRDERLDVTLAVAETTWHHFGGPSALRAGEHVFRFVDGGLADMRRNIDPMPMPRRRNTVQFIYSDLPEARRNWWLIVEPDRSVDLCSVDPGFDVDLYLATDLRTMTEIWMGYTTLRRAKDERRLTVTGDRQLEATLGSWLSLSPLAKVNKLVA